MSAAENKAVFLSYASQDAAAVERIAEALRAAGVEVWFDKNELVGGDAWDQKIRRQIKECAIFVPVISANTNARAEGYFRLEWKLAVDRSHLMADDAPFLFPVVIDDTSDSAARVPDKFREVQWTRLSVKDTPETLAKRVAKILGGEGASGSVVGAAPDDARGRGRVAPRPKKSPTWLRTVSIIGGLAIGLVYALRPMWTPPRHSETKAPAATVAPAAPAMSSAAAAPKFSEARQLAEKARALFDKTNSNADDFAVAESLLKRALELDANDGEIWAYSARLNSAYLTRSFERNPARAEAARGQAERAVKLAPDSAEAWHALGRAIWSSDAPRAEEAVRHALQLAPHDGRILLSLGSITRIQGRTDEALAFYVQAAAVPEVKSLACYDQFLIHLYMRRFAEADRCVRESIAGMPTTNNVTGLAMLEFASRGRVEVAARMLADAPAELRSEPRMVFATALIALVAKQTDEALRALDRLPGDFINDAWFAGPKALFIGLAHTQAGRSEAARIAWEAGINVVRRRLQDASNDPELHLRLGELLAWTGQTDAALREARVFEELQRSRTDWTYSSARIYAALGRADDAVPILEKYLTVTATGRWPLTPVMLRLDPIWSKLRDDPRFQALCAEPALSPSNGPTEKADAKPLSEAGQLAARALAQITKVGFTRDDLAPAEDLVRRATEKEPDNAAMWGVRAAIQSAWLFRGWDTGEKRRQETKSLANRALALDPNEPEALLALGHVLRVQRAFDQAISHLQRASAAHPEHVRLARALGYTLSQAGRDAEARVVLRQLVQRHPRDPLLRYELALAYCSYGRGGADPQNLAAALEHLDAAIAIQPFSSALILKAMLLGGWRGDLPAMRAVLDQQDKLPLAERAEDRAVCIGLWAGLMEHRPEHVEAAAGLTARNYFDDIVMPMRPKAWSLALAHRLAGKENLARADWQTAEAVLRQRLKDDPSNLIYQAELAITLAWLDRREEGGRLIAAIEPLWKEAPTLGGKRLLAMYYAALGDAAKAAPYLAEEIDQSVFCPRIMLPLDPIWEKIRGSPEFVALLKEPVPKK
jgi:tetratricopeptide (TPR) repeat protein